MKYGILGAVFLFLWGMPSVFAGGIPITVKDAYTRPAIQGGTGVVYFTMVNSSPKISQTLLAAKTDVSEAVEIHSMTMQEGIMRMRPVSQVKIPPGGAVSFEPGNYHIMLIGLKNPLKSGGRVPLTLYFQGGDSIFLTVPVQSFSSPAS